MASCRSDSLSFLMACSLLFAAANAVRPFPQYRSPSLATVRLQADDMAECWNSLLELRACTGEVILFFLNGETNLGPGCCNAIRVIEHRCWPSMLTSLGFTPDEGDILTNYCDALDTARRPPPPPPSPVSLAPTP
ncbi:unnamed protein product [Spirodela intermedia]|uniref:Prolamin-like domain-containing protein n=2 Tax=Spirodela intermedia TaxID=51605 RepID=A0A7I8KHA9_SPIIN|nr:unnamed protein product [Spirodela intermedia]CAA6660551.1 unnamed protein product [Spirodela intermedia]CAA7396902.1 unnamed protein product [Spirodela intermedia]